MAVSEWDPSSMSLVDLDVESDQLMVDQFFSLCDSALYSARSGSVRARQLLASARRLALWFPAWLFADLEVDGYLNRLEVAVDAMLSYGTDMPAA
jgi:hypothetical protein